MHFHSRGFIVGFLLVLGVSVVACQPIRNIAQSGEVAIKSVAVVESDTLSATITISDDVTSGEVLESITVAITETVAPSETIESLVDAPDIEIDPDLVAAGYKAYRAQYCGVCHTSSAAETLGTFGPPHDGMAAIAAERLTDSNYRGAATTLTEYIRESIIDPQAYTVPGYATTSHRMPVYAYLDVATVDGLVAFLLAN